MRLGMRCAGRAVTLRFVPHRPDIAADKPQGVLLLVCFFQHLKQSDLQVDSPEYVAFELQVRLL